MNDFLKKAHIEANKNLKEVPVLQEAADKAFAAAEESAKQGQIEEMENQLKIAQKNLCTLDQRSLQFETKSVPVRIKGYTAAIDKISRSDGLTADKKAFSILSLCDKANKHGVNIILAEQQKNVLIEGGKIIIEGALLVARMSVEEDPTEEEKVHAFLNSAQKQQNKIYSLTGQWPVPNLQRQISEIRKRIITVEDTLEFALGTISKISKP